MGIGPELTPEQMQQQFVQVAAAAHSALVAGPLTAAYSLPGGPATVTVGADGSFTFAPARWSSGVAAGTPLPQGTVRAQHMAQQLQGQWTPLVRPAPEPAQAQLQQRMRSRGTLRQPRNIWQQRGNPQPNSDGQGAAVQPQQPQRASALCSAGRLGRQRPLAEVLTAAPPAALPSPQPLPLHITAQQDAGNSSLTAATRPRAMVSCLLTGLPILA